MSLYAEQSLELYRKLRKMIRTEGWVLVREYLKPHERRWYDVLMNRADMLAAKWRNAEDMHDFFAENPCSLLEVLQNCLRAQSIINDRNANRRLINILEKSASHQIRRDFDCMIECKLAVNAIRQGAYALNSDKRLLSWAFQAFVHHGLSRDNMVILDDESDDD
jgi:hypothetical protein